MKFVPVLLAIFTSTSALAVKLDFSFNVNSSGPSIYPCDAGIKHDNHKEQVCYDRSNQSSCDPTVCIEGEPCNCVCTGGSDSNSDDYTQDFFTASHATWTDNGSPIPQEMSSTVTASNQDFSRIFTDKNEWDNQLTSLTYNLGSERYGSEFYLDVCYRGPQLDYDGNPSGNKYSMKLQSTITDLIAVNGLRYSELSGLQVKVTATCDLQGSGNSSGPATDNAQDHQINGVSGGDKNFSTQYTSFNAGANAFLLNDWINNANSKPPRFCKIRYSFIENMRNNTSNPLSQIRKWQKQQARISTFSDISSKREL